MKEKIQNILSTRISDLCKEKNISINQMLIEAKVNKSTIDNLKKGSMPSVEKIYIIAEYFNVTIDYLLGKTDEIKKEPEIKPSKLLKNSLSTQEWNLLNAYRAQPELQLAVNRLLGIENSNEVYVYIASSSIDNRPDTITRISKQEIEKIQNAPETDEDLM